MGYVPEDIAKELAPLMDSGRKFMAFFVKLNVPFSKGPTGLTVEIREMDGNENQEQEGQQSVDQEAFAS